MIETPAIPEAVPLSIGSGRERAPGGGMARLDGWPVLGGGSLVAHEPEEILEGNLASDAGRLREALERGRKAVPGGGLVGWVGFDGTFCFGVFPEMERMGSGEAGDPAARAAGVLGTFAFVYAANDPRAVRGSGEARAGIHCRG